MYPRPKPAVRSGGCCLIVADGALARFFLVEKTDSPRAATRLAERAPLANADLKAARRGGEERVKSERLSNRQAGDSHPIDARRQSHRLELERRFGRRIAQRVNRIAGAWQAGAVVLMAEPRLLGLMREGVRAVLAPGVALKELAKDYTHLSPTALAELPAVKSLLAAG